MSLRALLVRPHLIRPTPLSKHILSYHKFFSTSTVVNMSEAAAAPWYAAFPEAVSPTVYLPREEFYGLLTSETSGKDYVLVDLRRNDHTGGTIRGSINLPAQTLYPSIPSLYTVFKTAGVKQVIFYCGTYMRFEDDAAQKKIHAHKECTGSSAGRGSRAASWLQDYLNAQGEKELKSVALEGGIKGWIKAGEKYIQEVVGYDAAAWKTTE